MVPMVQPAARPTARAMGHYINKTLEENLGAMAIEVSDAIVEKAEALINRQSVSGPRYAPAIQAEVDTEAYD